MKNNKQPTKEEIKLEIAKSKSDSLRKKVENVYSLQSKSKSLKTEVIINSIFAAGMGIVCILSTAGVFNSQDPLEKAFINVWWLGFALEDAYSAYKKNKRKKDIDSDIDVLKDQVFDELKLTLG